MPHQPTILAVDLGGTHVRVAIVVRGAVRIRARAATDSSGPAAVVAQIAGLAHGLMADPPYAPRPAALGVAAPGPLDPATGVMHALPNLTGWEGFPLGDALAEAVGVPAFVHNDASLAALGEARHGAGRDAAMLVYLTVSTGIGGGIVAKGTLLGGAHGLAGELGHVIVRPDAAWRCGAGHVGCLEALASGTAIATRAEERRAVGESTTLAPGADARAVAAAAVAGDPLARAVFDAAATDLGLALGGFVNAFDPDVVVLGGGVALGAWDLLVPGALRAASASIMAPGARAWRLEPAALGDDSGLVGAAEWAAERLSERAAQGRPAATC